VYQVAPTLWEMSDMVKMLADREAGQ
jgi:hypothetical protein